MSSKQYPLTKKEFDAIYSKVPRLTVELIVKNKGGELYLTKRSSKVPCSGKWNLPGGTVFFGESVAEAVKRVGLKEMNIKVIHADNIGYIEYPSHYLKGKDEPVCLVFEVSQYDGYLKIDDEASDSGLFSKLPKNMHADQHEYLVKNKYLTK